MYNTHLKFHSRGDDQTRLLQSGWAAVLDRSGGQQNSGLYSVYLISLAHPVRILTWLDRRLVKFDPVGGPVMACIHGAIVAATLDAIVSAIVAPTGCGNRHRDDRPMCQNSRQPRCWP